MFVASLAPLSLSENAYGHFGALMTDAVWLFLHAVPVMSRRVRLQSRSRQ